MRALRRRGPAWARGSPRPWTSLYLSQHMGEHPGHQATLSWCRHLGWGAAVRQEDPRRVLREKVGRMVRLISQEEGIWFVWLHVFRGSEEKSGRCPETGAWASASPWTPVLVVSSMVSTAPTPLQSLLLASEGTVAWPSRRFLPALLMSCSSVASKWKELRKKHAYAKRVLVLYVQATVLLITSEHLLSFCAESHR